MTFIGSKISLISNLLVRYEGTLYTIDPRESTIALQNVRMMGTEDRPAEKVIKPTSTIYEYMIFKGENIKKLDLIKDDNEFDDPAIVEAKVAPSAELQAQEYYNQQHQRGWGGQNNRGGYYDGGGRMQGWGRRGRGGGFNRRYKRGGYSGNNRNRGSGLSNIQRQGGNENNRGPKPNNRRRSGNNSNRNADKKNEKKDCPGTGKFLERQSKETDDADLEIPDKEFDFQGNLARFDMSSMKEALNDDTKAEGGDVKPLDAEEENPADNEDDKDDGKEEVVEQPAKEEKPAYQKDSFF